MPAWDPEILILEKKLEHPRNRNFDIVLNQGYTRSGNLDLGKIEISEIPKFRYWPKPEFLTPEFRFWKISVQTFDIIKSCPEYWNAEFDQILESRLK